MMRIGKDELICDLAETYHIMNYKELPLETLATLSCGLRADSRIMMKISSRKLPSDITLLAAITDRLSLLLWAQSKDGQKGVNKPKLLLGEEDKEVMTFGSGEEFEQYRAKLLKGE